MSLDREIWFARPQKCELRQSENDQKEGAKKKYNDSCERSKDRLSSHPFIFVSMFLTKMDLFSEGGLILNFNKLIKKKRK
jgi:hypothetical protein